VYLFLFCDIVNIVNTTQFENAKGVFRSSKSKEVWVKDKKRG
jgi:hypothetical protein